MKELLQKLKELNLPKGKFAIFGSGSMGIRGIRKSRDLDIIATKDLFEECERKTNFKIKEHKRNERVFKYLESGDIEIYKEWGPGEWDVNQLIQEAEIIDDFPFVRLEEVLKWKKIKSREKDLKDIKLIEDYLEK